MCINYSRSTTVFLIFLVLENKAQLHKVPARLVPCTSFMEDNLLGCAAMGALAAVLPQELVLQFMYILTNLHTIIYNDITYPK